MNVEKELVTDDIGRTYPLESVRPFLAPSILQKMEERGQTAESMGTQAFFDACQEEHEKHKKTQYLLDRFVQDKDGKLRDYQQVNAMLDESFSGHLWTDLLPCTTQHYYETYSKLYKEANGREFTEKLDDMELSTMEALDMDRRYMAYRRMNIRIRTMKDLLEKLPKHPDWDFIKDYFDVRGRSQFRNVLEAKNEFYVATETVIQQLSSPIPPEVETVARRVEKYLPFMEMQQYPDISPSGSYLEDVFVIAMEEAGHRNLNGVADKLFDYVSKSRKDMKELYPQPDFLIETMHMSTTYPTGKPPARPYLVVPQDGHWQSFLSCQNADWVLENENLRKNRFSFAIFDTRNHASIIHEEPLSQNDKSAKLSSFYPMRYHLRFTMPQISKEPLASFDADGKEGLKECMRHADELDKKWMLVSKRCTDLHDIINTLSDARTAGQPIDFANLPFKGEGFEQKKYSSLMPSEENKFFQHLTEAYGEREHLFGEHPSVEKAFFYDPRTFQPTDAIFVKTAEKCLMDNMMQADVEDLLKKYMPQTVFGESFAEKAFEKAIGSPEVQKVIGDESRGRE